MKLSSQQIQAIINEIAKNEKAKNEAVYKKQKDALVKEKAPIAKKYFTMYNALPSDLRKHIQPYNRVTEKTILDSLVKVECKRFDTTELHNKIVIASIDANDLEELKNKLKIDF